MDEVQRCLAKNVLHEHNLLIFIQSIVLVDAQKINPQETIVIAHAWLRDE